MKLFCMILSSCLFIGCGSKKPHEAHNVATFFADLKFLIEGDGKVHKSHFDDLGACWIIKGQKLMWGETISIVPDASTIDTIFYQETNKAKWDTLICSIKNAHSYCFYYNPCCGRFNVYNKTIEKYPLVKGRFCIESSSNKQYLGMIGAAGTLIKNCYTDTIKGAGNSAMESNIFRIEINDIEKCKNRHDCDNTLPFYYSNSYDQLDYSFHYNTKKNVLGFFFLPLGNETVNIRFNPKTGTSKIEIQ